MLQQTRVDTVIPYFERFIEQFPTLEHLADADEESVLKAWEGLGYYSRARNLHSAVREVKQKYGGVVPDTEEEISKLKGVGSYTAGAILSIAYGKPVPAVDGNVMRVLSRILLIENDITKVKTKQLFEEIAHKLIPEKCCFQFQSSVNGIRRTYLYTEIAGLSFMSRYGALSGFSRRRANRVACKNETKTSKRSRCCSCSA